MNQIITKTFSSSFLCFSKISLDSCHHFACITFSLLNDEIIVHGTIKKSSLMKMKEKVKKNIKKKPN